MTSTSAPATRPLLATRALTRRFGDVVAVDGVDLAVAAGEVVGLIGANGAGKTTLIRMALGLLPPSAGRAELLGRPPSREGRRRIGYVPQGLGLYTDLTVAENLAFTAASFGVASAPREVLAARAPDLTDDADRLVATLPLGVRRRVGFLAALLHEPALLVLDEPTSGVDPLGRSRLWDRIRATADDGAGVLVTTHYLGEAAQCDRLVLLAAGRVVAAGTPADIVGDAAVVEVDADRWDAAFTVLVDAGLAPSLAGRRLRVPASDPDAVATLLRDRQIDAGIRTVPATLEERFVELAS